MRRGRDADGTLQSRCAPTRPSGDRAVEHRAAIAGRIAVLGSVGVLNLQKTVGNARVEMVVFRQAQPLVQTQARPLEQARAAISSRSIEALKECNRRCRQMIAQSPLAPPEEARAALATIRHWAMDQIAGLYDQFVAAKTGIGIGETSGADSGQDRTEYVEQADTWFDSFIEPAIGVLLEGDPQYRYEHFNADVQQKVFSVLRLRASRQGLAQIGHRAEAEAQARRVGGLSTGPWCGAFAFTQQNQAAGMDDRWAGAMQGEGGIRGALAYQGVAANPWIWAFDHWERLSSYHAGRGSVRWYEAIRTAPPARGIEPGDIVLIDNVRGTNPDHVTTAVAFDGRFLRTMGGNQGDGERGVSRNRVLDITANPEPNDVRMRDSAGRPIPETTDPALTKNVRVHGIGRWSIVDYEQHVYRAQQAMPTRPPSAAELGAVSR